jgi:hypothetical protein
MLPIFTTSAAYSGLEIANTKHVTATAIPFHSVHLEVFVTLCFMISLLFLSALLCSLLFNARCHQRPLVSTPVGINARYWEMAVSPSLMISSPLFNCASEMTNGISSRTTLPWAPQVRRIRPRS